MHYYIKGILSLFCNPLYSNKFLCESRNSFRILLNLYSSCLLNYSYTSIQNIHVIFSQKFTSAKIEMVDFNIDLGMDSLCSCYASVDWRKRIIWILFSNKLALKWKDSSSAVLGYLSLTLRPKIWSLKVISFHLVLSKY